MTIEIKYNIGDEVYYVYGWKIYELQIHSIEINIGKDYLKITYSSINHSHTSLEDNLFTTKEDAKSFLKRKIEDM